jgi:hypothetical protein
MGNSIQVVLQLRQDPAHLSHSDGTESYHIKVIEAPGQGWGGPLQAMGLDANQMETIRMLYRDFVFRQQTTKGQALSEQMLHPLRVAGNQLFQILPVSVQNRLHQAQAIAQEKQAGLELILAFEPTADFLLDLPWEILHNPASGTFFALQGGGVTRHLLLPTAPKHSAVSRPQEILGVWAQPKGVPVLDKRREYTPAPGKEIPLITWIQGPDTMAQMRRALDTGGFDGLHLVAHGQIGPNWSHFALLLEDATGESHRVNAEQMAACMSDYPEINFIYLDVCGSGHHDDGELEGNRATDQEFEGTTPGGLATHLLRAGVPTAVVMQDVMSQAAAGLAAQRFYQALAQGRNVADALTGGRRAVRVEQDDPIHWSIPALYRQRSLPEERSFVADWVLDEVKPEPLFSGLVLTLLLARLSHALAQVPLDNPAGWAALPPLLLESNLLAIVAAVMTHRGQRELETKYNLSGRSWLPFLMHKYFSALTWTLMVWIPSWLVWLAFYWAGIGPRLGPWGRQAIWVLGLLAIAAAGHVGARQAIRQNLLFLRVGYSVFANRMMDFVLLAFALFVPPFLLPLFLAIVGFMWLTVGGSPAHFSLIMAAALALLLVALQIARRND